MVNKNLLIYFLVFLVFFCIFFYIQFSFPNIAGGDDGYRHIKEAWLIHTQGVEKTVKNFPWMQCSIFKEHPGDPWFGFHILLFPFTFGDLTFGAKLSSVFFDTFLFLVFFWLLKKLKLRHALFWTFFLFIVTDNFNERLLLPRAYVISILLSLVGFYVIFNKKYLEIFFVSLFYSFITTESPLIIFIAISLTVIEYLKEKVLDLKPSLLATAGLLSGLLIRPDFPNNLYLIFNQIFSVLFLRLKGERLDFGGELSIPFLGSIKDNIFLFITLLISSFLLILKFSQKKQKEIPRLHVSLFFLSYFFAALTFLVGMRFVEYLVPFSVLLLVVVSNSWLLPIYHKLVSNIKNNQGYDIPFLYKNIDRLYRKIYNFLKFFISKFENKKFRYLSIGLLFFIFIYILSFKIFNFSLKVQISQSALLSKLTLYQEASNWLIANSPTGSVVLNDNWGDFPILLFYNHHNYYCNGMDPTFMYVKNPEDYWFWTNITRRGLFCGESNCDIVKTKLSKENEEKVYTFLKEELKGNYIFLSSQNKEFNNFLKSSERFEKVFKKGIIEIYRIKKDDV